MNVVAIINNTSTTTTQTTTEKELILDLLVAIMSAFLMPVYSLLVQENDTSIVIEVHCLK